MAAKLPPPSARLPAVASAKGTGGKKRRAPAPSSPQGPSPELLEPAPRSWVDRMPTEEDVAKFHSYRAQLRAQQAPTPDAPDAEGRDVIERSGKRRITVATFLDDDGEPPKKVRDKL